MASRTPAEVVAVLQAAGVPFSQISHGAVMTVEAQEAALAGQAGVVLKNLFIKDKKHRHYIVTAIPSTSVELGILSKRLGVGKGAVKFASEESLQEILGVPLGSVTPLAAGTPQAKDVVLFLDANIQKAPADQVFFVHPLVNTSSLGMTRQALEDALRALGRQPLYVDLEADPLIGKDSPPDLAQYTVEPPAPAAPQAAPAPAATAAAAAAPQPKKGGKGGKGGAAAPVKPATSQHEKLTALTSVSVTTQDIINTVAKALGGDPASLDAYTAQRLTADLEARLSSFKNAAYALGHGAGKGEVVAYAQRSFA